MKKGFTLTEVLTVLIVVGIIGSVIMRSFKPQDYREKEYYTMGNKALELAEQAISRIREIETTHCPMGVFLSLRGGKNDYVMSLKDSSGNSIDSTEVANLFKKYIRYETAVGDFCANGTGASCSDVKGAKLAGTKMYIGFKVYSSVSNCPAYRMPNETTDTTPTQFNKETGTSATAKCWGEFYYDTNGIQAPNTRGKDYNYIGLGEFGLAK